MFRMWGKIWKENHLLKDIVIECEDPALNRTRKVYYCLDEICYAFDLGKPIWLEQNKKEFILHDKVRFYGDSFIESVDFDYLELQVIEEDY
ncbi:MAG: hypothetical protein PUC39_08735 [Lachnospiraceae bacterium]|nr:hypothetical protein [Lachnospiraceae bacterium]